jgi:hypothetical protein
MMAKRIVVDDIQKKDTREQDKALRVKLRGKLVSELKQSDLLDLVLLMAQRAGLVDGEGKIIG